MHYVCVLLFPWTQTSFQCFNQTLLLYLWLYLYYFSLSLGGSRNSTPSWCIWFLRLLSCLRVSPNITKLLHILYISFIILFYFVYLFWHNFLQSIKVHVNVYILPSLNTLALRCVKIINWITLSSNKVFLLNKGD